MSALVAITTEEEMTMGVFWLEQVRLNLRSAGLACGQCQLVAALAFSTPWWIWIPKEGAEDDQ